MDLVNRNALLVGEIAPSIAVGRTLVNFALPLCLWAVALLLAGRAVLPDWLSGFAIHGPYLILASGLLLSLAFRRGRAFFVLLTFTGAYFAFVFFVQHTGTQPVPQTVYGALSVLVPFNIAVFALLRERGALNAPGLRRLSLLVVEAGAIAAIVLSDTTEFADVLFGSLVGNAAFSALRDPHLGMACAVAAVTVAVVCAVRRGTGLDAAFATAAALFALACNGPPSPGTFAWLCTMAGLIVLVAVVQDSYRMAFYDELTGLPGRRALSQRLASLDGGFTLAMVDIDHFKAFNDTWGHDIGDQVLRLVAARLRRVGGGGTTYRYGGEEFIIVFAGRRAISVMHHLESLRKGIENYKLTIRDSERPRRTGPGSDKPDAANQWIAVTVSLGVAERTDRAQAAEAVIEAADKALYRAKAEGRNRVSR